MKGKGCFLFLFFSSNVFASSLQEISTFAVQICDQISMEGQVTKQKVIAKIKGNLGAVSKLVGGSIEADGTVTIENTKYKGLQYEDLSNQMSDARSCRKEIANMLIGTKQFINNTRERAVTSSNYVVDTKQSQIYLMLEPNFAAFSEIKNNRLKLFELINGEKLILLGEKYTENIAGMDLSISWRQVQVASGENEGRKGWLPQSNIAAR